MPAPMNDARNGIASGLTKVNTMARPIKKPKTAIIAEAMSDLFMMGFWGKLSVFVKDLLRVRLLKPILSPPSTGDCTRRATW